MSDDLFRKAICCAPLSDRARIVLACLAQHPLLSSQGSAATVNTIAWEAQFSLQNTATLLRRLEKDGWCWQSAGKTWHLTDKLENMERVTL